MADRELQAVTKRGMSLGEVVAIVAIIAILAFIGVLILARSNEFARRGNCADNLRQLAAVLDMYASENGGRYPGNKMHDCQGVKGEFVVNFLQICPDYLQDPSVTLCPGSPLGTDPATVYSVADTLTSVIVSDMPNPLTGEPRKETIASTPNRDFYPCEPSAATCSYFYSGWLLDQPALFADPKADSVGPLETTPQYIATARMFLTEYTWLGMNPHDPRTPNADRMGVVPVGDLALADAPTSMDLVRLNSDIARYFVTDVNNAAVVNQAKGSIVVMFDRPPTTPGRPFNHLPSGVNVLFMDGHVQFIRYPGPWPVHPALTALADMDIAKLAEVGNYGPIP